MRRDMVGVRLTPVQKKSLELAATDLGQTSSSLMRMLVAAFLRNWHDNHGQVMMPLQVNAIPFVFQHRQEMMGQNKKVEITADISGAAVDSHPKQMGLINHNHTHVMVAGKKEDAGGSKSPGKRSGKHRGALTPGP